MISFTPLNIRTWSLLGASGAFGLAALELPEISDSAVLLTADLCHFSGLDRFKAKYPDRLYNVGIAEQNLIGVAAGMAKEGLLPFATTYASFASTRCCDQVRVSMGYMKLGVKLIGLASGLSVGILGATHMSLEDVAIMRSIPNITVVCPADTTEIVKAVLAAATYEGPVYLRLGGSVPTKVVYETDYAFEIGRAITLREGSDISIIASGTMVYHALRTAEILEESGVSCGVINMHTIKPLDVEAVRKACDSRLIVTAEEHSVLGGLGSAVAECLAEMVRKPPQLIIGISDEFKHPGSYEYLLDQYGLMSERMAARIIAKYREVAVSD